MLLHSGQIYTIYKDFNTIKSFQTVKASCNVEGGKIRAFCSNHKLDADPDNPYNLQPTKDKLGNIVEFEPRSYVLSPLWSYIMITPNAVGYRFSETYLIDDEVHYRGSLYKSLQNDNTGKIPTEEPTWWDLVETPIVTIPDGIYDYVR